MSETPWGSPRTGPRKRYGKAGRPLTPAESRAMDTAHGKAKRERAELDLVAERHLRDAHERWQNGQVVPAYITSALDMAGLYGPEVDEACGVAEPAVDEWEAGTRYPTWEQLQALGELTQTTPTFFVRPLPRVTGGWTTLELHLNAAERRAYKSKPMILGFTEGALRATLGTVPDSVNVR